MMDVLNSISWPAAFTILGTLGAIAGTVIKLFKDDNTPHPDIPVMQDGIQHLKEDIDSLGMRLAVMEKTLEALAKQDTDLKEILSSHDRNFRDAINAVNQKIEKSNDIIIDILKTTNIS